MEERIEHPKSLILSPFSRFIEWGNRWLTLSHWLFRSEKRIFLRIEALMLVVTLVCVALLLWIDRLPSWLAILIAVLLIQRILEFLIVYSRNFILNRGRIFSHFTDEFRRGQWLILMFSLNIIQVVLVFSVWYRLIGLLDAQAFSQSIGILDSLYFSTLTFLTVGYGDIVPLTALPKILVIVQAVLTFYTLVIVINGLISIHFKR